MQTLPQESEEVSQPYPELLNLPKAGRSLLVGMTRSGKTTLKLTLIARWLARFPRGRVLIVDSKPCFRAQWQTSGLLAAPLYRRWDHTQTIFVPGSYVVPLDTPYKSSLNTIWKHSNIAIVQGGSDWWDHLLACAQVFYEGYSSKQGPRMLDVDEIADFYEVQRTGGILMQILRSGGQMGVGVCAGTQRPKYIPKTLITETDRVYLFKLKNEEDLKALQKEGGLPRSTQPVERLHEFRFFDCIQTHEYNGQLFQLAQS